MICLTLSYQGIHKSTVVIRNFLKYFVFDHCVFTSKCQIPCQGSHFLTIKIDDGPVILTVLFSISSISFAWDSNIMWSHSLMHKWKSFYWNNHDARKHIWIIATLSDDFSWKVYNPPDKTFYITLFLVRVGFFANLISQSNSQIVNLGFYVNWFVLIKLIFQFVSRNQIIWNLKRWIWYNISFWVAPFLT